MCVGVGVFVCVCTMLCLVIHTFAFSFCLKFAGVLKSIDWFILLRLGNSEL